MPALHRAMLREFNSRQFVLFLETLTGIDNLLPDPYFIGGGLHLSGRDDFLKVHADFNWHHKLQAHRRVNALMYLSEEWDEEWAGRVEFWDRDMTGPVDMAYPKFNRLVVFSTSENSNHGQPRHNLCQRAPIARSSTSTTTRLIVTTRMPQHASFHAVQDWRIRLRDRTRSRVQAIRWEFLTGASSAFDNECAARVDGRSPQPHSKLRLFDAASPKLWSRWRPGRTLGAIEAPGRRSDAGAARGDASCL